MTNPRVEINKIVRRKATEVCEVFNMTSSDMYAPVIKQLWHNLYDSYASITGFNIYLAAEERGYDTLGFVEKVGIIDKLHELAIAMYT